MIDKNDIKKIICPPENLLFQAGQMKEGGAEFLFMECRREAEDEITLDYTFNFNGVITTVSTHTQQRDISSLYSIYPGSDYPEREAAGLFQVKFIGNPNLAAAGLPEAGHGEKKS
ncbi:MAG: NADH-quinone oxidoreductase subunit C [Chloroflexi bacterium]|nr:NADH-quinone oxidoreductase subunit C [Chloroflexota bacterium]